MRNTRDELRRSAELFRDNLVFAFRNAYKAAFGVRPAFAVSYLSNDELRARTKGLEIARCAGRFLSR